MNKQALEQYVNRAVTTSLVQNGRCVALAPATADIEQVVQLLKEVADAHVEKGGIRFFWGAIGDEIEANYQSWSVMVKL